MSGAVDMLAEAKGLRAALAVLERFPDRDLEVVCKEGAVPLPGRVASDCLEAMRRVVLTAYLRAKDDLQAAGGLAELYAAHDAGAYCAPPTLGTREGRIALARQAVDVIGRYPFALAVFDDGDLRISQLIVPEDARRDAEAAVVSALKAAIARMEVEP